MPKHKAAPAGERSQREQHGRGGGEGVAFTLLGVAVLDEQLIDGFGDFTRSVVPLDIHHQRVALALQ